MLETVVDQPPVVRTRDPLQGKVFELAEGDVHPLKGHVHSPVKLPQSGHAAWVCKAALVAGHRVSDHAKKVPAVPPAGFCSVLRVKSPARLHQMRLGFKQMSPRLVDQLIRSLDQAAGQRAINAGDLADRGQLIGGELALGFVSTLKNAARGLRQILVGAESLNLCGLHQGLEVSVLKVQGLTLATGVAISQPWRSR